MIVWRIATAAEDFRASELGGVGSAKRPGRWNQRGQAIVYAAGSRALAMLETLGYVLPGGLPQNRYLISIDIPDPIWAAREVLARDRAGEAVESWDAIPRAGASMAYGAQWLKDGRSAVPCVPSVIVPEEFVVLINPGQVQASGIKAQVVRKVQYEVTQSRPGLD